MSSQDEFNTALRRYDSVVAQKETVMRQLDALQLAVDTARNDVMRLGRGGGNGPQSHYDNMTPDSRKGICNDPHCHYCKGPESD